MAADRIDSIIDLIAINAEFDNVKARLTEMGAIIKTSPKADLFANAGNSKELSAANAQLSSVMDQLKVKNAELTVAIKQQNLAAKEAAQIKRDLAQAAKDQAIADAAAAKQAQIAGTEKLRALQAQKKAEEELLSVQKERAQTDIGTYQIAQGSGQSGNTGLRSSTPIKEAAFIPATDTEASLLFLSKTQAQLKQNQAAQKDLGEQLKANAITQEQYNAKIVAAKAAELEYKKQIQLTNVELKARTNADFAIQGSIEAAKAQNAILVSQRNALPVGPAASDADVARLKELNAEIDKNNELIDKNNDLLGRQKINIGNYPNAFGAAFKTLNTELDSVQGKLVSGNFKGAAFDQLTAKLNVLQNAASLTGKEFTTVAQQQKAYAEASTQIGLVYGKNSEVFKTFSSQVKEGNVNVKGLATEVSAVTSKGRGFLGFLGSAYNGLRKLAYAIPGIGIGGLILLLLGPLESVGAALVKWSKNASAAGRASEDLKKKTEELNTVVAESVNDYGKAVQSVSQLTEEIKLAKEGFLKKEEVLKHYNETIGKTTGQVKTLDEAESNLIKNGPDFIKLLFLKAEAVAAYAEAAKAAQKSVTSQADAEKDFGVFDYLSSSRDGLSLKDKLKQLISPLDPEIMAKNAAAAVNTVKVNAKKIRDEQQKSFADYKKMGDDFTAQAAKLAKDKGWDFFGSLGDKTKKGHEDSQKLLDEYRKKDLEAMSKYAIENLKILQDMYKNQYTDQNLSEETRLRGLQKFYDVSLQLIQANKKAQEDALNLEVKTADKGADKIKSPKLRADTLIAIEKYRVDKLKEINQTSGIEITKLDGDTFKERVNIAGQAFDKMKKDADDYYKFIIGQQKIAFQNQKDNIGIDKDNAILKLQKDFENGSIKSQEEYNQKRSDIEDAAAIKTAELELKQVKDHEAIVEALYGSQNISFIQQEADLEVKINDLKNKKKLKSDQELDNKRRELRNQLEQTFQDIVGGSFDAQKNKNDADLKAIQDKSQKEIDAINASGLAQTEKDKKIMAIQKQADFQTQQIEKRQRQQDIQRAKFDKAVAIAKIIQNTADAITKDLILNKALIPLDIAIGAAQLASVLASPIPKFAKGTKNAPKGTALVSEEGPELMVDRHGKMFLTPARPSLIDLAGGERIFKHSETKDILNHYNLLHIMQKANANRPQKEKVYDEKIYRELRTLNSKPPVVINVQSGLEASNYYLNNIKR